LLLNDSLDCDLNKFTPAIVGLSRLDLTIGTVLNESLANASQWFNPAAFIAPPSASGFYGTAGRDTFMGPGLATWEFSVLKDTASGCSCSFARKSSIC
jgi:hypothetical protein